MTHNPGPGRGADPDPSLDDTQRIEPTRYTPPPTPRSDDGWGPPPCGARSPEHWFEPADTAPRGWSSAAGGSGSASTATSSPVVTPVTPARRQAGVALGPVLAASLLSAVLAAGGTVLVIDRTGALNRPASPTGAPSNVAATSATAKQPVTIDESSAIINAAARVSPAVVKIEVQGSSEQFDPFGTQPIEGIGSGVIFDPNGWVLTNKHVVSGSDRLTVELKDGRAFPGRVYGIDTLTDLAIVKLDQTGLPAAALGTSDGLKIGQLVVAIGSPLGTYSFSVTSGIVSGTGRSIQVDSGERLNNLIQTDAAINPGNSGGPLIDAAGSVVGINTAVARNSNGIGFAIPVDIARPIMDQALQGEDLARPYIGIRFRAIDPQLATSENLPVTTGALVETGDGTSAVEPNSPAAEAGIEDGDIITSIEGIQIDAEHPLEAVLTRFPPGRTISIAILRDGKPTTLQLKLGTRPAP